MKMESFKIYQASEKENVSHAPDKQKLIQENKPKRATLAVLTNHPNRSVLNTAAQLKNKTDCDKNNKLKVHQPKINKLPVEQFKSFSVYEDELTDNICKTAENLSETAKSSKSDKNFSSKRDPLREISSNNELLDTPMSVSEILSPMSIDQANNTYDENKPPPALLSPIRNDRDRFFEVEEYQQSILEYFRKLEKKNCPKLNYMQRQPDIDYSMRAILVDWLVEVAEEYHLQSETVCLAVSYIDRFLSVMSVIRAKLQLVGTGAMLIAAKYEEIYPPEVAEFVFITDDTYTKSQVLRMEQILLKILSFDLCNPTTIAFVNFYSTINHLPDDVTFLAKFFCELSLLDGQVFLPYLPSQISAAAIALARYTLGHAIWCDELTTLTTYTIQDLIEIIIRLCKAHKLSLTREQQAIQEKYQSHKYMKVATIKPIEIDENLCCFIKKSNYGNTVKDKFEKETNTISETVKK